MAEIRWLGHNCFRIKGKEAVVLTDPVDRVTGYAMAKQTADIVTLSHKHAGHINLSAVRPEFKVVDGPGEYEMHDIFITGIRTHHDTEKGAVKGHNTVYVWEIEGIAFCHLGDLGHPLTEEQAEAIGDPDIVFVPAGGGDVLTPEQAAEVVSQLAPKIVIPMQFQTDLGDRALGDLEPLVKALGVERPEPEEKLVIRASELGETLRLIVLAPEK